MPASAIAIPAKHIDGKTRRFMLGKRFAEAAVCGAVAIERVMFVPELPSVTGFDGVNSSVAPEGSPVAANEIGFVNATLEGTD